MFKRKTIAVAAGLITVWAGSASTAAAQTAPNPERRGIGTEPFLPGEAATPLLLVPDFEIDPRRSLFVTEKAALKALTFKDVMQKLADDAVELGDLTATPDLLFEDWWAQAGAPFCHSTVNGFSYDCPRPESNQTAAQAFGDGAGAYILTAAVNRLDLAATDWSNCGEQRLVFARMAGEDATPVTLNRNLLIFEASIPNPAAWRGKEGCAGIASFWAELSDPTLSAVERGGRLRSHFLGGWGDPAVEIVSLANYGFHTGYGEAPELERPLGQIRSNQFMGGPGPGWLLREFRPRIIAGESKVTIAPQILAANPEPSLFAAQEGDANAAQARQLGQEIIDKLANLAVPDINQFSIATSLEINTADGHSQKSKGSFLSMFQQDGGNGIVRSMLATVAGKPAARNLSAEQLVNRVEAMSCGGCHQSSNGKDVGLGPDKPWPVSAGFVHVDEMTDDDGVSEPSFKLSPALTDVFLPFRLKLFKKEFFGGS